MRMNEITMSRYVEEATGRTVVKVYDLSFLTDQSHPYGWLRRHFLHHWLKWALRHSDTIVAANDHTAFNIHRFYFVPLERIEVRL